MHDLYLNTTAAYAPAMDCLVLQAIGTVRSLDADLFLVDFPEPHRIAGDSHMMPFYFPGGDFQPLFDAVQKMMYDVVFTHWLVPWPPQVKGNQRQLRFFVPNELFGTTSVHQSLVQGVMDRSEYCPVVISTYGIGPGVPPNMATRAWPSWRWYEVTKIRAMLPKIQPQSRRSVHLETRSVNFMRAFTLDRASLQHSLSARGLVLSSSGRGLSWVDSLGGESWMTNLARQKYVFAPSTWNSPGQVINTHMHAHAGTRMHARTGHCGGGYRTDARVCTATPSFSASAVPRVLHGDECGRVLEQGRSFGE